MVKTTKTAGGGGMYRAFDNSTVAVHVLNKRH